MTNEELLKLVKEHTDKFGLVQPTNDGRTSGNGHVYSAEMYIILNQLGLLADVDKQAIYDVVQSCKVDYGLYNRAPDRTYLNAQDDLIGITALAHEMEWDDITKEIVNRAETPVKTPYLISLRNVFDNTRSNEFIPAAWLGRFPVVIAHFYFAARQLPSIFYRLAFTLDMLASVFKTPKANHHDYWLLGWLMAYTARGQSGLCDLGIKVFFKQVEKHGGIAKIAGDYFANYEHPIVKSWDRVKV